MTKGELPRAPRRLRRQIFVGEPDLALGWMTVLERKAITRMRWSERRKGAGNSGRKLRGQALGEEELTIGNATVVADCNYRAKSICARGN